MINFDFYDNLKYCLRDFRRENNISESDLILLLEKYIKSLKD